MSKSHKNPSCGEQVTRLWSSQLSIHGNHPHSRTSLRVKSFKQGFWVPGVSDFYTVRSVGERRQRRTGMWIFIFLLGGQVFTVPLRSCLPRMVKVKVICGETTHDRSIWQVGLIRWCGELNLCKGQGTHHGHHWKVKRKGTHMHVGKGHPIPLTHSPLPFFFISSPLLSWTLLNLVHLFVLNFRGPISLYFSTFITKKRA